MRPLATARLLGLAVLVGLDAACAGSPPPEPAEIRNLLILSIDTLRPDHLGCYGYHRDTSPELDRFAARSAVFEQAVTVHVSTAPAHATADATLALHNELEAWRVATASGSDLALPALDPEVEEALSELGYLE